MTIYDATAQEIETNFGLYQEMIKIMKTADGKAPVGSCCGKNKHQHITQFLQNKDKYMKKVEEIKNRTILPKWKGVIYIAKLKTHYSADTITDAQANTIIKSGALSPIENYFDIPALSVPEPEKAEELEIVDIPAETPKKKKSKKTNK